MLVLVVVAALLGAFGQQATTTVAEGRQATLSVEAPTRLRGGLVFQARFEIDARQRLAHPRLVLSPGWLESMTQNTLVPTPLSEDSSSEGLSMAFEEVPADRTLIVWSEWQVNPTNVGRRSEDATLFDGSVRIASVERTVTVFP